MPPEYFEADKRFRQAQTLAEKIACLELLISTVPKHKGTDKLRADLRRQLSRLKEEAQVHKKHGSHQILFHVDKEGAGQAVLMGPTNVGKSALLAALTNAEPEVSPVPFTTWRPIPGMMPVEDIQVQLIDTPALDREYVEPALFDLARHASLLLMVVDLQADPLGQLEACAKSLEEHSIGAPSGAAQVAQASNPEAAHRVFIPRLILVNKFDDARYDADFSVLCELFEGECPLIPVSALTGRNFGPLKRKIVECLDIIRVYAKPPGKEPDLKRPFVLHRGSTIADLARLIHRDFSEGLRSARVWGSTAFAGQMVHRDHLLKDGDIVELRI